MTPTPKQIERDLAEKVMGWPPCLDHTGAGSPCWLVRISEDGTRHCHNSRDWSPTTSRDDCAEVLARLTDEQWTSFLGVFPVDEDALPNIWFSVMRGCLTATPAQIAEAVWRTTCQ